MINCVVGTKNKFLQPFKFKISYYPSQRFKQGWYENIVDDYENTFDWLSVDVEHFLPDNWKKYYPGLINLAFGHTLVVLVGRGVSHHDWYIFLDWNLNKINTCYELINSLLEVHDYYYFPAPSVRISPNVRWFGLKF